MIDEQLLLNEFEATAEFLSRKKFDRLSSAEARDGVLERKAAVQNVGAIREEANRLAAAIGEHIKQGDSKAAEEGKSTLKALKQELAQAEVAMRDVEARVRNLLLRIPNLPSAETPVGFDEGSNVVLRSHGFDADRYQPERFRPHWEVAQDLDIYDPDRSSKISGSGFSVLKGDGVRLLDALVAFAKDLNRDTYLEVLPPHFVTTQTFTGTGHLPKFEEDAYRLRDDDLWAIPTGEVPLMGLHRDEILAAEELPKRYMAYTVCFRREAGSAGKDTRGMQRLHEFHKVEMLKLCAADQVEAEFKAMLADAERPLQLLNLPYRVVDLCTGDLTFSSRRIFDLEVYAPGVDKWLEVSSVGDFGDFQSRRSGIRYRSGTEKPRPTFALNGSAIATPRVWAAIIEHYQEPDGSVRVPDALVKYMGKDRITKRT